MQTDAAVISNSALHADELLETICTEFGIDDDGDENCLEALTEKLFAFLLENCCHYQYQDTLNLLYTSYKPFELSADTGIQLNESQEHQSRGAGHSRCSHDRRIWGRGRADATR